MYISKMDSFWWLILSVNFLFSCGAYFLTLHLIPSLKDQFIRSGLSAIGVITGCVFLLVSFLFQFIRFSQIFTSLKDFPHGEFMEMIASSLSICCMILLGFADDVLDLRWRHKLLFPTLASVPLLTVYYASYSSTTVILPKPLRELFGNSVDIGLLYYIYMGMLAVFCTNAINIYAGINGLEVGQSIVIGFSVLAFNILELFGSCWKSHVLSLYLILPFLAVSLALYEYNKFPSKVFVGDTYCYFAGMLFAVVAILGHFSKTVILFFLPQIFNFIYSLPQLFHFVPCPRHRFPRLVVKNGKEMMEPSFVEFSIDELSFLGKLFFNIFKHTHLIKIFSQNGSHVKCNNFTLLNFAMVAFGSVTEDQLTRRLLIFQGFSSCLAFCIRYPLASLFYDTQS